MLVLRCPTAAAAVVEVGGGRRLPVLVAGHACQRVMWLLALLAVKEVLLLLCCAQRLASLAGWVGAGSGSGAVVWPRCRPGHWGAGEDQSCALPCLLLFAAACCCLLCDLVLAVLAVGGRFLGAVAASGLACSPAPGW